MVKFFLGRGIKPDHPDDQKRATPLAWAERRGRTAVIELLT